MLWYSFFYNYIKWIQHLLPQCCFYLLHNIQSTGLQMAKWAKIIEKMSRFLYEFDNVTMKIWQQKPTLVFIFFASFICWILTASKYTVIHFAFPTSRKCWSSFVMINLFLSMPFFLSLSPVFCFYFGSIFNARESKTKGTANKKQHATTRRAKTNMKWNIHTHIYTMIIITRKQKNKDEEKYIIIITQ